MTCESLLREAKDRRSGGQNHRPPAGRGQGGFFRVEGGRRIRRQSGKRPKGRHH